MMRLFLFIIFIGICLNTTAQFSGGANDGHHQATYLNPFSLYKGGDADGYGQVEVQHAVTIYAGGTNDGYHQSGGKNAFTIYRGGNNDGYHQSVVKNAFSIYSGASNDGYHRAGFKNAFSIYSGGAKDGYSLLSEILIFEWTGAISTHWNVAGNWRGFAIPDINSRVIIPSGLPNYPVMSTGLMSIGQDVNSGVFLCRNITIKPGASITLGLSTFLENYGRIDILGNVFVLNQDLNAFKNLTGGDIIIHSNGLLQFQ